MKRMIVSGARQALLSLVIVTLTACGQNLPEDESPPGAGLAAAPESQPLTATAASSDGCGQNPFGQRLLVGGELEAYVAFRAPWDTVGHPAYNAPVAQAFDHDVAPHDRELIPLWAYSNTASGRNYTLSHDAVAADLNGDGRSELVQVFRDANAKIQILTEANLGSGTPTVSQWLVPPNVYSRDSSSLSIAAGNIDRSSDLDDEIVWAGLTADGIPSVYVLQGTASGGIDQGAEAFSAYYHAPQFPQVSGAHFLSVATGDLDGDTYDDEIVLAFLDGEQMVEIIVLEYDTAWLGGNAYRYMRRAATTRFSPNATVNGGVKLAVGNIDGKFGDEIIVAVDTQDDSDNKAMSTQLQLRTFKFELNPAGWVLTPHSSWDRHFNFSSLALAVGDTDRDGLDEIALAFNGYESTITNPLGDIPISAGFNALTLDAEYSDVFVHNHLFDAANYRSGPALKNLSVAVGDMDKDGLSDILVAFNDGSNSLQTVRLEDQEAPLTRLSLVSQWRDTQRKFPADISVVMGDWTNDSVWGRYESIGGNPFRCDLVVDPQVSSTVFVPPFWQKINGQSLSGFLGKSDSVGASEQTTITSTSGHSISAYVGVGVGIEQVGFEANVQASASREWSHSVSSGYGGSEGTEISEAWTGLNDFAIVENHTSRCYSYQLYQGATAADGWTRVCEHLSVSEEAPRLDSWDTQYSPINGTNLTQWVPLVRDWSNLALFRRDFAVQSSTCASGRAMSAVDGWTDDRTDKFSQTCLEAAPWWQVDLGSSREVGKVRLWNRKTGQMCGDTPCASLLKDFYVLVSDTEFRDISNDINVLLADPRVRSYAHPGMAGPETTFLTLEHGAPIRGRYVRVQLAGSGVLSLAEVQVFSGNHVNPDRYPRAVRDSTPGDGSFEAEIFNPASGHYEWVPTKGDLLWDGAAYNVMGTKTIGPGGAISSWSLTQERTKFQTEAEAFSNSWSAGVSAEMSVGAIFKVQTGVGYTWSGGVTREDSRTFSYGQQFELSGGVGGFPPTIDGVSVLWPSQCRYQLHPYYYEKKEFSNDGVEHRFLVVDYTVPDFLDRSSDLQPCRDGTYTTQ